MAGASGGSVSSAGTGAGGQPSVGGAGAGGATGSAGAGASNAGEGGAGGAAGGGAGNGGSSGSGGSGGAAPNTAWVGVVAVSPQSGGDTYMDKTLLQIVRTAAFRNRSAHSTLRNAFGE